MKEKVSNKRNRVFAFIVYPESSPADWKTILERSLVPAFISPLHDQDLDQEGEEGKPKKAHYHVMLMYDGMKSFDQVKPLIQACTGSDKIFTELVQSKRGYARYLCHLDNPEKHQYLPEEVQCFSGANYNSAIGLVTDRSKCLREMLFFIRNNGVTNFAEFCDYCAENNDEWFQVATQTSTYFLSHYIKSYTFKLSDEIRQQALKDQAASDHKS